MKAYLCWLVGWEDHKLVHAYSDGNRAKSWMIKAKALVDAINDQIDSDIGRKYFEMRKPEMESVGIDHNYYNNAIVQEIEIE